MVDFNNESVITVDRTKIVTVVILQQWDFVIACLGEFNKFRFDSNKKSLPNKFKPDFMSAVFSLFSLLRANMMQCSHDKFEEIKGKLNSENPSFNDYYSAWLLMDEFLCSANLTRFYYQKGHSARNTFDEYEAKMS